MLKYYLLERALANKMDKETSQYSTGLRGVCSAVQPHVNGPAAHQQVDWVTAGGDEV